MKNSAIDSTSEILNADQMSMCRSCSRARRGPRPPALAGPRPRKRPAPLSVASLAAAPATPCPVPVPGWGIGGTGAAPAEPEAPGAAVAPVELRVPVCEEDGPAPGIDCVDVIG